MTGGLGREPRGSRERPVSRGGHAQHVSQDILCHTEETL